MNIKKWVVNYPPVTHFALETWMQAPKCHQIHRSTQIRSHCPRLICSASRVLHNCGISLYIKYAAEQLLATTYQMYVKQTNEFSYQRTHNHEAKQIAVSAAKQSPSVEWLECLLKRMTGQNIQLLLLRCARPYIKHSVNSKSFAREEVWTTTATIWRFVYLLFVYFYHDRNKIRHSQ